MSILQENAPLLKFRRSYIWNLSGVFPIFLLVKILIISMSLSLKLYLINSLVYDQNIFGFSLSLAIFKNINHRKSFIGNIRVTFGQVLENLRKSSASSQKSSENRQKHCYQYVCKKKHYTLTQRYEFHVLVARRGG